LIEKEFKKGFIIKLGNKFHKIVNIEDLHYKETVTVAATTTSKTTISELRPESDEIYLIRKIGINGGVTIHLYFPRDIPRGTPHGGDIKLDRYQANYLKPKRIEFAIKQEVEPYLNIENAYSSSITADIWFYGLKFRVVDHQHIDGEVYTELLDYSAVQVM